MVCVCGPVNVALFGKSLRGKLLQSPSVIPSEVTATSTSTSTQSSSTFTDSCPGFSAALLRNQTMQYAAAVCFCELSRLRVGACSILHALRLDW